MDPFQGRIAGRFSCQSVVIECVVEVLVDLVVRSQNVLGFRLSDLCGSVEKEKALEMGLDCRCTCTKGRMFAFRALVTLLDSWRH